MRWIRVSYLSFCSSSRVRDMSRIVTKSRTRDEEQKDKYDTLIQRMIELGYNEHSAEVVLKYAANNLWKD